MAKLLLHLSWLPPFTGVPPKPAKTRAGATPPRAAINATLKLSPPPQPASAPPMANPSSIVRIHGRHLLRPPSAEHAGDSNASSVPEPPSKPPARHGLNRAVPLLLLPLAVDLSRRPCYSTRRRRRRRHLPPVLARPRLCRAVPSLPPSPAPSDPVAHCLKPLMPSLCCTAAETRRRHLRPSAKSLESPASHGITAHASSFKLRSPDSMTTACSSSVPCRLMPVPARPSPSVFIHGQSAMAILQPSSLPSLAAGLHTSLLSILTAKLTPDACCTNSSDHCPRPDFFVTEDHCNCAVPKPSIQR